MRLLFLILQEFREFSKCYDFYEKSEITCFSSKNKTLCKTDFSPYFFPPVNFKKAIFKDDCEYEVHILRQPKEVKNHKNIIKQFEPRFQFKEFPLVFSHINPLIIVVEK